MTDNIKLKMQKLLTLSENNANESERDEAMIAALRLSNEYNISLEEARQFNNESIHVEQFKAISIKLEPYLRTLIHASCKLFFCKWYISNYGNGKVPTFVGTRENIETALNFSQYLLKSVQTEAKTLYKKDAFAQKSFKLGAANTIYQRAIALTTPEVVKSSGTALMVIKTKLEKANEEFTSNLGLRNIKARSYRIDAGAYESGKDYGNTVSLNRQIKEVKRIERNNS